MDGYVADTTNVQTTSGRKEVETRRGWKRGGGEGVYCWYIYIYLW